MKTRYKNSCALHSAVVNLLVETIGIKTLNKVKVEHYEEIIRQIVGQIQKIDLICSIDWYGKQKCIIEKIEGEQLPF